jgi:hypothetical protein
MMLEIEEEDGLMKGLTSMEYILHSAPSLPLHLLADRDARRGITLHDRGETRAGYLSLSRETPRIAERGNGADGILSAIWSQTVISDLVDDYFDNANILLPIVSRQELEEDGDGLLRYAAALVAATKLESPVEVFQALRLLVDKEIVEQGE